LWNARGKKGMGRNYIGKKYIEFRSHYKFTEVSEWQEHRKLEKKLGHILANSRKLGAGT
jgi:hypothetical protein